MVAMELHGTMKRLIRILLPAFVLLLAGTAHASMLSKLDGTPASISGYAGKGQWLVVMIWGAHCTVCNAEVEKYVDFYHAHKDKDATVLGISMDGKQRLGEAKKFVSRHHVDFPNLIGEPEAVTQMFTNLTGATWVGTPSFMIYDPKGKLVVQQVGAPPVEQIESFIKRNS